MAAANQMNGSRAGMSAEGDHTADIDYFNWLPDDVVKHIFKYVRKSMLLRCALVSQRWRSLACHEDVWRNGYLKLGSLEEITLPQLSRCLQLGLIEFVARGGKIRDPVSWDTVFPANFKSQLRYLRLHGADISAESIACILRHTEEIDRLHLYQCKLNADCFYVMGEDVIVRHLYMSECLFLIDIPHVEALLRESVRLETLLVSTCSVTDEACQHLRSRAIANPDKYIFSDDDSGFLRFIVRD